MEFESILIAVHVLAAITITGLVLIQRGKGADIGASFGSGASQTMFGSIGSGNFLTRSTTLLAVVFFATSLGLAIIASERAELAVQDGSLLSGDIEDLNAGAAQEAPAEDPAPAGDVPQAPAESDAPAAETGDLPVAEDGAEADAEPTGEAEAAAGDAPAAEQEQTEENPD